VGSILADAIGVAVSPLPIVAVVLMLATPRGRVNGMAFTAAWAGALTVVVTVVVLLGSGAGAQAGGAPTTGVLALKLALGVLFLLLAAKQFHDRPRPGHPAATPRWMSALDSVTPVRAAGLAVLLTVANPKNLALAIGGGAAIAGSKSGTAGAVVAVAVFVLIGSACAGVPLVVYLLGGQRASQVLESWKAWMAAHNNAIMTVLLLVLGAKYVGDAIGGLA
jgi:hypothetical protein